MRNLFYLYATLLGFPLLGYLLRRLMPKYAINYALQFIHFIALPFLIITSVSANHFIGDLWLAPLMSIVAIALGGIFGLIAIDMSRVSESIRTLLYSSKLISALDNNIYYRPNVVPKSPNKSIAQPIEDINTGASKKNSIKQKLWQLNLSANILIFTTTTNAFYIAFPIILILLNNEGSHYFTIAIVYSLCSIIISYYALFKILKHKSLNPNLYKDSQKNIRKTSNILNFQTKSQANSSVNSSNGLHFSEFIKSFIDNKFKILLISLISGIVVSLLFKNDFPKVVLQTKLIIIQIYLIAIGMQVNLSKYKIYIAQIAPYLIVKMIAVPLVIAAIVTFLGLDQWLAITILIMTAMPPALLDYQISKQYGLSGEFQSSCHSIGLLLLGFTMPIWTALFMSYS